MVGMVGLLGRHRNAMKCRIELREWNEGAEGVVRGSRDRWERMSAFWGDGIEDSEALVFFGEVEGTGLVRSDDGTF